MISLHQILPQFKEENKLQKVQCVVLTDGEGCSLRYSEMNRHWDGEDGPFLGTGNIDDRSVIERQKNWKYVFLWSLLLGRCVTNVLLQDFTSILLI